MEQGTDDETIYETRKNSNHSSAGYFQLYILGSEYLFDNMIRYATDSAGVVRAQNYVLGISVIGFLLFPCINRYFNQKMREIGLYLLPVAGIICIFVIQEHLSYRSMLYPDSCFIFYMA